MIDRRDLINTARAKFEDADVLFNAGRYDGAIYICGYAIELALKARICATLEWEDYPYTGGEFRDYQSFRTHDLDVLLHLSGQEKRIRSNFLPEWSAVKDWEPEARYNPVGTASAQDTRNMLSAAKKLLREI